MNNEYGGRALRIAVKFSALILLLAEGAGAATLTVDDSGGADYTRIQDAIDNANAGDTVLVYSGTYYENVNVNKQLILRGVDTGNGKPVVDAKRSGNAITLSTDQITLEGFNATNTSYYMDTGIKINSNNSIIKNNDVSNNGIGFYLSYSSNNTLNSNNASNNFEGFILVSSTENNLYDNNANLNENMGIRLYYSSNNRVYHNNLIDNKNQAYDNSGTNSWDSGYPGGGNYWSDYSGSDTDGDGIGDIPYLIIGSAGVQDGYPFIQQSGWASSAPDTEPPASITNLTNACYAPDYINWTWTEPQDLDLSRIMVYFDGAYLMNVSKGIWSYNATGLLVNTMHTISTKTIDTAGNTNSTWINHTAKTMDTLSYYRSLGSNPVILETTDLLRAADDWSNDVAPPGFCAPAPIKTVELLSLADEWSREP